MADRIDRNGTQGYEDVFDEIENYVNGLSRTSPDEMDQQFFTRVELAKLNLDRIKDVITVDQYSQVKTKLDFLISNNTREYDDVAVPITSSDNNETRLTIPKIVNGKPGNNRYNIDKDYLEQLLSMGYSVSAVATNGMLGSKIHPNTVYKFMKQNGLKSMRDRFTTLSDAELTLLIKDLNSKFPNSGIREITAMLKNLGPAVIVQRDRVARILSNVDPHGTSRRWAQVIPRRVYSVATPNSLWHIDTHHSLIR